LAQYVQNIKIEIDSRGAVRDVKKLDDSLEDLEDTAKKSSNGFDKLKASTKKTGDQFKRQNVLSIHLTKL